MQKIKIINFWLNSLSPHQIPYIRELAKHFNYDVNIVVPEEVTKSRKDIGWEILDCSPAQIIINPNNRKINEIINNSPITSLHVFSGINVYPFVHANFKKTIRIETNRAIISEACNYFGILGLFRILKGKYYKAIYNKYINEIFAISSLAVKWYKLCGYSNNKINPFAYFTDTLVPINEIDIKDKIFRIIFVGRFMKLKGIDLIIRALSTLAHLSWEMKIIGAGPEFSYLKLLSDKHNLGKRITFYEPMRNEKVIREISKSDILLLPSIKRGDGWGAVVNEALMCGTPVICSNRCGAADLIKDSNRGKVIPVNSVRHLKTAIEERILNGKINADTRKAIVEWSNKISGYSGAKYFSEVISSKMNKSNIPWKI